MNFKLEKPLGLSKPADLLGLAVCWLLVGFFLFPAASTDPKTYLLWIGLTSWFSLISLYAIGFFEHHIPKPELSGLVSLLIALPFSAFLSKWLLVVVFRAPRIGKWQMSWAALLVAVAFESWQALSFKIHRAMGAKWTLLTHLHPEDLKILKAQIAELKTSSWIRVRPLEGADLSGRGTLGNETVVISRRSVHNLKDSSELISAHLGGRRIVDVRQLLKEFRGRVDIDKSDGWTFLLTSKPQHFYMLLYFYMKTVLEPVVSMALGVILLPFFAVVSLAILLTSGWPILYRQERSGHRGKPFMLYKFRTMSTTAEKTGAQWASQDDPRVTPLGRMLRRTRIDELPQLLNVIRGDLGFIGPRPERPEFYDLLQTEVPLFSLRLLVRPGITGWAQIRQGYASSVEECKSKLEYDLYYVQNMSHELDFRVIVETMAMMIRGSSGR